MRTRKRLPKQRKNHCGTKEHNCTRKISFGCLHGQRLHRNFNCQADGRSRAALRHKPRGCFRCGEKHSIKRRRGALHVQTGRPFRGRAALCKERASGFDIITINPPYICTDVIHSLQPEVLREPMIALDGGADGLEFYRRIRKGYSCLLNPGGVLLLETGFDQGAAVSELLRMTELFPCFRTFAETIAWWLLKKD